MLSIMLGYKYDLKPEENNEMIKQFCAVWMVFKKYPNVREIPLTQEQYEEKTFHNYWFLKYIEGEEEGSDTYNQIIDENNQKIEPRGLWAAIVHRFKEEPVLNTMDREKWGSLLIGIKSLIECMNDIRKNKKGS